VKPALQYFMNGEPHIFRGIGALQRGRWSTPGADYFVTGNLERPRSGLTPVPLAGVVRARLHALEETGHWRLRTFVLMPDHFHLLVTLGGTSDLSVALREFKGPLTPALRRNQLR